MSSVAKKIEQIEQIELELGKLKLMLTEKAAGKSKTVAQRKRKDKPDSIEACNKKSDLEKFTVKELKEWIKKHKIDTKGIKEKHKEDFVKLVWKNLKKLAVEESSSESDSSESSESGSSSSESD